MQIGIDLGATKIEYVLLDNNNVELKRDRIQTPKDYENTIISITEIIKKLKINNNFLSENDANCFCLSEAFDGSASHYETVFGIILGSGCGGGLVINKKIIFI